jgi:hypothetical protein
MRAFLIGACLLVALTGCSNTDPTPDDAMAHISRDIFYVGGQRCQPSVWITGVIVNGPLARDPAWPSGQSVGVGIQDDINGVIYGLIWGGTNTARVEYGKRYKLGGAWFGNPGIIFWTCAGAEAVIPQ